MESAGEALSLLESTARESNVSMLHIEQFERLKCKIRGLESEIIDLKRLQPRLTDARGKDHTEEFAKLVKEMLTAKDYSQKLENENITLRKRYMELEQSAISNMDQREKEIERLRNHALELEQEVFKLHEQIQDEQSKQANMMNKNNDSTIGDAAFDAALQRIYQDSLSLSNTVELQQKSEVEVSMVSQNVDVLDVTTESVAVNLAGRTSNLAEACVRMFEQLRGTAEFFQGLLKNLGVSEDELGKEMMRKIESLKLDLNRSMHEAHSIVSEARNVHRTCQSIVFEQSRQSGVFNQSHLEASIGEERQQKLAEENQQLLEEKQKLAEENDQLAMEKDKLAEENGHLEEMKLQLMATNEQLMEAKLKLSDENEQLAQEKERLAEEKDELEEEKEKLLEEKEQLAEQNEQLTEARATLQEEKSKLAEEKIKLWEKEDKLAEDERKLAEEKAKVEEEKARLADEQRKLSEEKAQQLAGHGKQPEVVDKETEAVGTSSSAGGKENVLPPNLVQGIRGEMNKILDTMTHVSNAVSSIKKSSGKKHKAKTGSSSSSKQQQPGPGFQQPRQHSSTSSEPK